MKGAVPKEARRILVDNDTNPKRPDWGYSGWLEVVQNRSICRFPSPSTPDVEICESFCKMRRAKSITLRGGDGRMVVLKKP